MQKHRKKTHYKKIAIGAVAVGIVGIPTAAMACLDTQETGAARVTGQGSPRPSYSAPSLSVPVQIQEGPEGRTAAADRGDGTRRPTWQATRGPQKPKPPTVTANPTKPTKPTKPATPKPPAPTTSQKPTTPAVPTGVAAQVVALANKERAKVGCSPLTVNAKLTTAAQNHSKDMAAHGNMSHTGSDGSDPGQRITRAGYTWRTYGENVAYGYSTPEKVMTGWMNSPGHKANILNCSFKEIGVGLAQPNSYWTQVFGAAR
ncbi:CAP domain-containing protein [Streptomyces sp. NPDC051211]|uniref:CAP domain-containing protein n=1 Tax=Streptomyces sp. NPDC051211 TaxID=3154643 RepID=UPI00344BC09F